MHAGFRRTFPLHRFGLKPVVTGLKVGLLGGSFDPPHQGHVHVTEWAFRRLGLDQVWWLVAPQNPLKQLRPAPLQERIAAARRVQTHPRVMIIDLETHIQSHHTINTLEYLVQRFPAMRFVWLMGADNLQGFTHWSRWQNITDLVPMAVFLRPGHQGSSVYQPVMRMLKTARLREDEARRLPVASPPAWCLVTLPLSDVSSTSIRLGTHQSCRRE